MTRSSPTTASRAKLGILLSGRGSNLLAIAQAIDRGELDAEIAVVISNIADAPGLAKARELGLEVVALSHLGLRRKQHEARVVSALVHAEVDWVCLAGYMRLLTSELLDAFPLRIVNIHPSLLPAFPGLAAQEQAWNYGVAVSGCTVHLVDSGMDTGPIVLQEPVYCHHARSAAELSCLILEAEHRAYPLAMQRLIAEPWRLEGRRVTFGETLP